MNAGAYEEETRDRVRGVRTLYNTESANERRIARLIGRVQPEVERADPVLQKPEVPRFGGRMP